MAAGVAVKSLRNRGLWVQSRLARVQASMWQGLALQVRRQKDGRHHLDDARTMRLQVASDAESAGLSGDSERRRRRLNRVSLADLFAHELWHRRKDLFQVKDKDKEKLAMVSATSARRHT